MIRAARSLLFVRQGRDDLPECEQTFVDIDRLFIDGAGLGLTLRAGQVDQLQFRDNNIVKIADVNLLYSQTEHGMAAAATIVHIMTGNDFVANAKLVQSHDIVYGFALEGVQILHCKNIVFVPFEL